MGVFDEISELVTLAISIAVHKIPVSYVIGTTFLNAGRPLKNAVTITFFTIFVLSTPIGVVIGTLVGESENVTAIVVLQSISAGIFLYLACCHLLIHEFEKRKEGWVQWLKFCFFATGVAFVIVFVTLAPKHEH